MLLQSCIPDCQHLPRHKEQSNSSITQMFVELSFKYSFPPLNHNGPNNTTQWHTVWHRTSNLTTINNIAMPAFHLTCDTIAPSLGLISSGQESWAWFEPWASLSSLPMMMEWPMTNGWHIMEQFSAGQCKGILSVIMSTLWNQGLIEHQRLSQGMPFFVAKLLKWVFLQILTSLNGSRVLEGSMNHCQLGEIWRQCACDPDKTDSWPGLQTHSHPDNGINYFRYCYEMAPRTQLSCWNYRLLMTNYSRLRLQTNLCKTEKNGKEIGASLG